MNVHDSHDFHHRFGVQWFSSGSSPLLRELETRIIIYVCSGLQIQEHGIVLSRMSLGLGISIRGWLWG